MFRYLVMSDLHLGHRRVLTHEIIRNLDKFFNYFSDNKNLDAIFIAGDFFDTLLDNHTTEYHEIVVWVHRLISYCSRNNIKLRVLEGTPSHDWNQCRIFQTLVNITNIDIDFKYVNSIYIEFLEDQGLYILYVPDEATESSEITYEYIKALLAEQNIFAVDIAIMHGMFSYQMMNIVTPQSHNESAYLDLVKYYIHIGHIHTHSIYSRIIAQGSFDRLSHNEEEPKGLVIANIDTTNNSSSYEFIENKTAKIFKTINISKTANLETVLERLDKVIFKLPELSFVRIKASKDHIAYQAFEELKKRYLNYTLSKKSDDDHSDITVLLDETMVTDSEYSIITINPENITDMMFSAIDLTLINQDRLKQVSIEIANQV